MTHCSRPRRPDSSSLVVCLPGHAAVARLPRCRPPPACCLRSLHRPRRIVSCCFGRALRSLRPRGPCCLLVVSLVVSLVAVSQSAAARFAASPAAALVVKTQGDSLSSLSVARCSAALPQLFVTRGCPLLPCRRRSLASLPSSARLLPPLAATSSSHRSCCFGRALRSLRPRRPCCLLVVSLVVSLFAVPRSAALSLCFARCPLAALVKTQDDSLSSLSVLRCSAAPP